MILNDIERAVVCGKQEYRTNADFIDAIEQAIIAKLAKGVEMPEPVGYLDGQGDSYTADQLRTVAAAARLKALEDAADTCDSALYVDSDGSVGKYGPTTPANPEIRKCADAIRALKGGAA